MPTNPIFILFVLFLSFGVLSLLLKPLLNKDTRAKIASKTNDFYDINQGSTHEPKEPPIQKK